MLPGPLSELLLREFWERQPEDCRDLLAASGESVRIVSRGTPNYDSGPDFREALVRIGGVLFRGDVELHVHAGDWVAHRHHLDARYNSVILHVACRAGSIPAITASGRELPLLLLPPSAQTPVPGTGRPRSTCTEPPAVHCHSPRPGEGRALIRRFSRLGIERMGRKVLRLEHRLSDLLSEIPSGGADAEDAPWEQLLYEGILEGLGYSKNRPPFLRLARVLELADLRRIGLNDREGVLAALFGAAGLLPRSRFLEEAESRCYVRRLRRRWRELQTGLRVPVMHETEWKFFRLRPANLPTARLASFAFLLPQLFGPGRTGEMLSLFCRRGESCSARLLRLRERFLFRPDEFWARHLYFGTPQHSSGIALGRYRVDDIIVNTVLPWLLLYAGTFRHSDIEQNAILTYRTYPPLQRNRITWQVERSLTHFPLAGALLHQGALEWVGRFCSRQRCALCPLAPPGNGSGTSQQPVPPAPGTDPRTLRM